MKNSEVNRNTEEEEKEEQKLIASVYGYQSTSVLSVALGNDTKPHILLASGFSFYNVHLSVSGYILD